MKNFVKIFFVLFCFVIMEVACKGKSVNPASNKKATLPEKDTNSKIAEQAHQVSKIGG